MIVWVLATYLSAQCPLVALGMKLSNGFTEIDNVFLDPFSLETSDIISGPLDDDGGDAPYFLYSKGHIQTLITERDIRRQKNATWKTYFAEILAASILLVLIIVFLCWWNCTHKRSRRTAGHDHHAIGESDPHHALRRHSYAHPYGHMTRQSTLQEIPIPFTPVILPKVKCSKDSCFPPENNADMKEKRRWNYKEDNEPYKLASGSHV